MGLLVVNKIFKYRNAAPNCKIRDWCQPIDSNLTEFKPSSSYQSENRGVSFSFLTIYTAKFALKTLFSDIIIKIAYQKIFYNAKIFNRAIFPYYNNEQFSYSSLQLTLKMFRCQSWVAGLSCLCCICSTSNVMNRSVWIYGKIITILP